MRNVRPTLLAGLTLTLALQACGADGGADDPPAAATAESTATAAGSTSEDPPTAETSEASDDHLQETGEGEETEGAGSGGGSGGSATLTVAEVAYEFDHYYCVSGDDTGNNRVSFSSGAMGKVDGVRVQLDVSIQDPSEQGMVEGAGTLHTVSLSDTENFADPSVSWAAQSGFMGEPAWLVVPDGSTVTAEATFDDASTDEIEEVPGTLEASCGS